MIDSKHTPLIKFCCFVVILATLQACTNYEYHETRQVEIFRMADSQEQELDELLLDVGVILFNPGEVDLDTNETDFSSVRDSEAVWFTNLLKSTLDESNAWGLVRALPNDQLLMDLSVTGTVLVSNGEFLTLHIKATDSSGKQWMDNIYHEQASQYAYNPEVNLPGDPFQALFSEIANDLFTLQEALSNEDRLELRRLSKVLFASNFVPDAYAEYISEDEDNQLTLLRIPADNDPMFERIENVRARNDLFVDVLQDYYRSFNVRMGAPYQEWRKLSYKEVLKARQLKDQARRERIAGVLVMAGGLATASNTNNLSTWAASQIGIFGGARLFIGSILKSDEALAHGSKLRELGESLEGELEPSIIKLQDRTVTLTGTVEQQYQEWRRILAEMYKLEESGSAYLDQPEAFLPVDYDDTQ